jgi:sulfite reductase beta subunit-like hemoprotein
VDWFRAEMKNIGFKFGPARPFNVGRRRYSWGRAGDGRWFLGLFVQDGRIQDAHSVNLKTACAKSWNR